MKKILSVVAVGVLTVAAYLVGRSHTSQKPSESAAGGRRVLYWVDPMHPDYKSDHAGTAPDCGMQLEPVYADAVASSGISRPELTLAAGEVGIDGEVQQMMGIRTVVVKKTVGPQFIRVLGRVVPEDTRVYRVDSGTDGFIRETHDDSVGTLVKKDQKLASCYGPEYLSVASGFLAATAGVPGSTGKDGSRTMPFPGAVSKQGVSSLQGYTDRLRNLGMSELQIKEMAENRQLPESIDIVAPADGLILARNITPGQHYDRSTEFYRIADISRVWIIADTLGSEADSIRPGTAVRVTLANGAKSFSAKVTSVLPQIDPATRTMKLRLEADNPRLELRPDMFVNIELPVAMPAGITVPVDAVVDSGREQRVYVERSNGVFEPRQVRTGWHFGEQVQILDGLSEGERVVAEGTFLVDSESRMKSNAHAIHEHTTNTHASSPMAAAPAKSESCESGGAGNGHEAAPDSCKATASLRPDHMALTPAGH